MSWSFAHEANPSWYAGEPGIATHPGVARARRWVNQQGGLPIKSRDLHVTTTGHGPNLVLLHGWGFHGEVWASTAATLSRRYRVVRPDLPGHGRSNPSPIEFRAESVVAHLAQQFPSPAVWLGWSLGATLALELALAHPRLVRGLVVVAGTPCFGNRADWEHGVEETQLVGFGADLERDWRATLTRFLNLHARGAPKARTRALRDQCLRLPPQPEALRGALSILAQVDLRPRLGEIHCPVTIIGGDRDLLVPASGLPLWSARIPRAQVRIIPGAGHMPFVSHRDAFETHLENFLDRLDTDQPSNP